MKIIPRTNVGVGLFARKSDSSLKGIESHASLFLLLSAVEEVVERHPVCQNLRFVVEPCKMNQLLFHSSCQSSIDVER